MGSLFSQQDKICRLCSTPSCDACRLVRLIGLPAASHPASLPSAQGSAATDSRTVALKRRWTPEPSQTCQMAARGKRPRLGHSWDILGVDRDPVIVPLSRNPSLIRGCVGCSTLASTERGRVKCCESDSSWQLVNSIELIICLASSTTRRPVLPFLPAVLLSVFDFHSPS